MPGEVRIVFVPPMGDAPKLKSLESGVNYYAFFFNPSTGKQHGRGKVRPDAGGSWQPSLLPTFADWVIVLARRK
jgi:hypothetical protein